MAHVFRAAATPRLKCTNNGIDSFTITLQVLSGGHHRRVLPDFVQSVQRGATFLDRKKEETRKVMDVPFGSDTFERPPHQRVLIQDSVEVIH